MMFGFVKNLKRAPKTTKAPAAKKSLTPQFEMLETREVPASISGGNLMIYGTNAIDRVSVNNYNSVWLQVTQNGTSEYFMKSSITTGNVFFYGNNGDDTFANNVNTLQSIAYGGAGNDTLIGDGRTDWLYGEGDNDTIYGYGGTDVLDGGAGNDKIYGGTGYDYLYGGDHDDFLDAGAAGESVTGGNGYDINAWVWAVNGATYDDVIQGASNACWIDSAMSSAAFHGVNFASRISYAGNNWYNVGIYSGVGTVGAYVTESVYFDGTVNSHDARLNPNQEGETWALLTQRAYLELRGLSISATVPGNPGHPLQNFTGRNSTWIGMDFNRMSTALSANQNVVCLTKGTADQLSTTMLVPFHAYTVMRVESEVTYIPIWTGYSYMQMPVVNNFVVLRNPHGADNGGTTWGNPNDGLVRVSWADFSASMVSVAIN